jgi:tellurite resistance protein TehA-like permease
MNQRRTVSWLLPIVGLAFVATELQRLFDARAAAEACVAAAQDGITCEAAPDALFFVVAGAFGLVFLVRLAVLALEYYRSAR